MKRCEYCGRKLGKELRGLITLLIVLLAFGLAYIQAIKGGSATLIAPWVAGILGSVVSMYFQARGGEVMRRMTRENAEKSLKD
jgi:hypothetical protein